MASADEPASGDYRTATSGNWNANSTWQTFNGFFWVAASSTPTTQAVTIQSGDTVTVTRRVTVNQVLVQSGGTITNAQNLRLGGNGTALDIFGTVNAEGLQTTEDGTILTNTIWPLATSTTSIVETGGSLSVDGGDLEVDCTLLVAGGTVTTAAGDDISGSGTMTISGGTVTVGAPGHRNDFSVDTLNMTGGLLFLGGNFSSIDGSLTGGTVQFAATDNNFQISQFTYANVILSNNATVRLNLGNGSTVINGDLRIMGTTVVLVSGPLTAHSLTLGGTTQGAGTWGGLNSGAGNINTTYFSAASPGDYITVTTGEGLVVTLPGETFTSSSGNSGTVSNQTAGTSFNVSLYAIGVGGNVLDTNYSGTKTITYSGAATAPGGTAPSYTTNVTFINGVATNIATTLTAAQTTTMTASAADGTATGVASSSLTVVAGTLDHYGINAASPQNVGEAFPVTVTAQDPFNNPVTTDSATPVTLGSSTGNASFGSNPITLTNDVFTVSAMDNTVETVNLTAADPDGKTGTLVALVIGAAPAFGDFRSANSGNWNDNSTWQTFNGSIWGPTFSTPTTQKVTIQSGDTVAITRRVTVNQVLVQSGGTITNAQNLRLGGSGTALDIFGTVLSEGIQTAADGTADTNTIWPLAANTTSIVEPGGSLEVDGGDLEVDGALLVAGGNVTTAAGDNLDGNGTLSISNGTVTVGAPGQNNDCNVRTVNMTGGLLVLGRGFSPITENLTGGTVEFTATQTGFQIPQLTYANVILSGGGNGVMNLNLGNGDFEINGNLSITGTTLVSVRAPFTVHSLTLGGITQGAGTWGGPVSGADNINTIFFAPAVPGDFITVGAATATLLAFTTQPTDTTNGATMTAVVVQLQDQFSNNIAGSGTNISLALNGGGTLGGTTNVTTDASGQATFTNLTITGAGGGKSFTASTPPLTSATSSAFNVAQASTTNIVSVSANPTPTGSNVVFTATLSAIAPGGGTPTGTVQFLADGSPLGLPATLSGGAASVTNNSLSNGFHVITAQYAGDGNFTGSTNNLNPDLLVNSAPVAQTATYLRPANFTLKIRIATLATNWSDADGDPITLTSVAATSTNGISLSKDNTYIYYNGANGSNPDQFSYVISDGFASTPGLVNIVVTSAPGTASTSTNQIAFNGGVPTLRLAGIPGRTYYVQASTNLAVWVDISTNVAGTNGLWNVVDADATNHPSRFYRTSDQP